MNFKDINVETVELIENYCKQKLLGILVKSDWKEDREVHIQHLCQYPFYSYSNKALKLYKQFYGLIFKNTVKSLHTSIEMSVAINSSKTDFSNDYNEDDWYLEVFFSKLLNVNLYYIGEDNDLSRICIDDNYNFYTVSSYGIELWGRKSFYQGLYNLLFRDDNNPYFFRYALGDYIEIDDYPRNVKGEILWTDLMSKNPNEKEFAIDLNK